MNAIGQDSSVHFPTHEFHPFIGGIGVYIEETARACAAAGTHPVIWAPDYGGTADNGKIYQINRVPMRGKQDWICRWRMGSALAGGIGRKTLDSIVLAEPGPVRWWMYSFLTRPPRTEWLVVVLHGSEVKLLSSNPWWRFLLGRLLNRADCIGVVSNAIRKRVNGIFPQITSKVRVVPGAVRCCLLDIDVPDWDHRKQVVLQVGRLHPRKGQLQLVEAFARLPEKIRRQYKLRLLGPHSKSRYVDQVRRLAAAHSVTVDLPGAVGESQLIQAYREARVVAMPSQPYKTSVEGLGMALLEAQYMGCPVVATDVGGVREALVPGVSGYLVPPGDCGQLAGALVRLIEDPRQAHRMGIQGRQFVIDTFSWKRNAQILGLI